MGPMKMASLRYNPREIENKWQSRWQRENIYHVADDDPRPKWYELTMYPYPSGDLHIGHWYAMAPADAHARFKRMQGYKVLHPMGFDAFGLPAENAATFLSRAFTSDNKDRSLALPASARKCGIKRSVGLVLSHAMKIEPRINGELASFQFLG